MTRFRLFLLLLTVALSLLLIPAGQVYYFAQLDQAQPADAAVVLGAAVFRNRPSPVLQARIDHAITLYEDGQVEYLIFTGGLGSRDTITEAAAARTYALAHGIPAANILIEEESTDTQSNLQNVANLAAQHNIDTVLIVSTPYHMKRALLIADAVGLHAYSSPTRSTRWLSPYTQFRAYAREVVALIWYYTPGGAS